MTLEARMFAEMYRSLEQQKVDLFKNSLLDIEQLWEVVDRININIQTDINVRFY